MKISNVTCPRCHAEYERAESESFARPSKADSYRCEVCSAPLEQSDPATLLAYRLVLAPDQPLVE
jgi:transposase-like protein